jgi:hypothetical protein
MTARPVGDPDLQQRAELLGEQRRQRAILGAPGELPSALRLNASTSSVAGSYASASG